MCYKRLVNFISSLFFGDQSGQEELDTPTKKSNSSHSRQPTVEVDWLCQQNTSRHHTNEYENDALVLRRGETFNVGLTFKDISFGEIMKTAFKLRIDQKGTTQDNINKNYNFGINESMIDSKWGMVIVEKNPEQLHIVVKINIPVDAPIGRYSIDIAVLSSTLKKSHIIILFNPWNEGDDVYLAEEDFRNEYVLSDSGLIYRGTSKQISPVRWNYGQFEEHILDCVLRLLEKYKGIKKNPLKSLGKRKSPVMVARILSAVINSQEDGGVLAGNWSGDYEDGVSPSSWNGSVEILQEYYSTEKPVKYGQCWVFSGVMTTALRALGIPARSITNFDSAHDTDETMTIDAIYDEDGDRVEDMCSDSIWNFHVWNEIWTKRNDLPDNTYDGWQAVDSTPQEESSGLHQMGPAPLKAIKEGAIYAGHDTGFVFAEVNADYVKWVMTKDEHGNAIFQKSFQHSRHVGKCISTKKVGADEREDITNLYKHSEKSSEERKAFENAFSFGKGTKSWIGELDIKEEETELTLDLGTSLGYVIPSGEDFTCIIDVKNISKQSLTINLTGVIKSMQYTGQDKMLVKRQKFEKLEIDAGTSTKQEIHVSADEYVSKLTDLNCLKFVVVAKVLETGKQYIDDCKLQIYNKDSIEVDFLSPPIKVDQRFGVTVTFTNPLPVTMTNVTFAIEGKGLTRPRRKRLWGNLKTDQKKTIRFDIIPWKSGDQKLLVDIDSSQAKDFKCFANVKVLEA